MEPQPLSSPDQQAPPALTWRWGVKWQDFAPEAIAAGLFEAHWKEGGPYRDIAPLNVNHLRYRSIDAQGMLDILVVRDGFEIAGYLWTIINRCSFARDVSVGQIEAIYAAPAYRGPGLCGGLGWKLIKAAVERLRSRNITVAKFSEKASRPVGAHMKRLGFVPNEISYRLVLKPVAPLA